MLEAGEIISLKKIGPSIECPKLKFKADAEFCLKAGTGKIHSAVTPDIKKHLIFADEFSLYLLDVKKKFFHKFKHEYS